MASDIDLFASSPLSPIPESQDRMWQEYCNPNRGLYNADPAYEDSENLDTCTCSCKACKDKIDILTNENEKLKSELQLLKSENAMLKKKENCSLKEKKQFIKYNVLIPVCFLTQVFEHSEYLY